MPPWPGLIRRATQRTPPPAALPFGEEKGGIAQRGAMKPDPTKLYGVTHRLDGTPIIVPTRVLSSVLRAEIFSHKARLDYKAAIWLEDEPALKKAKTLLEYEAAFEKAFASRTVDDATKCLLKMRELYKRCGASRSELEAGMRCETDALAWDLNITPDEREAIWKRLACEQVDREALAKAFELKYPLKSGMQRKMLGDAAVYEPDYRRWRKYDKKFEYEDSPVCVRIVESLNKYLAR
jgi:hypothetical protein